MQFEHTVLDNRLTIICEANPAAASMALGFFVRTGSRDETRNIAGASHFLEHMMFKGTARRSAFDVNREFDAMGAQYNAFTTEENTVYFGAVLPDFRDGIIDLLGDIMRPAIRQEDFDVEKNVILDEIARYEDQPPYRLYEKLMGEHFRGHPLGNSVLGTIKSISALKREDLQAYFERRYSPGNVTVVAVGKMDFAAVVAKVAAVCGHWKPYDVSRELPAAPVRKAVETIVDAKLTRQHVGIMSPAPSGQDEDRYAAHLAATIMGDTNGSRLFYALVDPAIADDATTEYMPLDAAGAFLTFVTADPGRAAEAVRIAQREFGKFRDEGPGEPELLAAKNKIASAATLAGELPLGRLTSVGRDWVYCRQYVPLREQIDKYFAVTAAQVLDLARRYDLTAATILGLGPAQSL